MAEIHAFRGIRYDLGHVGALSDVVAPPYDVIDPPLQDALYKRHPANVVRLILNRPEPGDDEVHNRYARAARFFHQWQREGLLFAESQPALYVYHQEFQWGGQTYVRRGFLCRVRLEPFGTGSIFPHEQTMPGPKQDRLRLFRACKANLSPIFGLFPDEADRVQPLLENRLVGATPLEATDHLGVVHRLWPLADAEVITAAQAAMRDRPLFVADGHHRYETACTYRDELAAQGPLDPNHPANFVLMMCVAMSDPGLLVLPTHRLFRGLPALDSAALRQHLAGSFEVETFGTGAAQAEPLWEEIEMLGDQGTLGLYTAADDTWSKATVTAQGRRRMADLAADHSQPWRELGVSLLHRLLVADQLGAAELPDPVYVHQVQEVVQGLKGGQFPLAALVMPATLEHIRAISRSGERMPAKSTYFYPKLLSGLVFNPLE